MELNVFKETLEAAELFALMGSSKETVKEFLSSKDLNVTDYQVHDLMNRALLK